jgi:hypothetical protein
MAEDPWRLLAAARERIEDLEEEIRGLKKPDIPRCHLDEILPPAQVRIMKRLSTGGAVHRNALGSPIFMHDGENRYNTLNTHIAQIRVRFRQHCIPIVIKAVWGIGYEVTAGLDVLRRFLAPIPERSSDHVAADQNRSSGRDTHPRRQPDRAARGHL